MTSAKVASLPGLLEGSDLGEVAVVIVRQALQREAEGMNRAFEPLQQIHRHEGLEALFATRAGFRFEAPLAVIRLRVVENLHTWRGGSAEHRLSGA